MRHKNIACAALLFFAVGCTHMIPVTVTPTDLPSGEKSSQSTVLLLNKDFVNYTHDTYMMGDTFRYQFGPALEDYARHVAKAAFEKVQEESSEQKAFSNPGADVVLIPRAMKSDQSMGVWAASKVNITLVVEWEAKDRVTHNTVWLKTVTADATEPEGNAFTHNKHQRVLLQKLFDDLNLKTYDALQKASEFRSVAR